VDARVKSVLFTLLDITELVEAEREVERLRSIVQVMRFKPGFETFARELVTTFSRLAQCSANSDFQLEARRALHTAKGVLAQFSLLDLARRIHEIEDSPGIQASDLDEVQLAFRELLQKNFALWQIQLDKREDRFVAPEQLLRSLEGRAERAESLAEVRAAVAEILAIIRERQIGELAGPLEENHDLVCRRVGKLSTFILRNPEVTCPPHLVGVFGTLTHLVRNAVGHGVELPWERGEKPECATVELIAERGHDELTLTVADDGRGIDVERLAERAVAMGALSHDSLAPLSYAERLNLIFIDQMSTASEVTETSGRGIGMSAVKEEVERLHGRIDVESTWGRGTRITVRLPLGRSTALSAAAR
jgi:chemotaxis protein histidine kinase CheA